jgi:class 3 adenylate cyclase
VAGGASSGSRAPLDVDDLRDGAGCGLAWEVMAETELPAGTVTFLLTDIEGSTRLWETGPEAMEVALERHNRLLTGVIEEHGGWW